MADSESNIQLWKEKKGGGGGRFGRRWENCLLLKLATFSTQNTDTQWSGQEQSIRLESWEGSTREWCCQCASPKRKLVSTVMFGPCYGQMWMYSALKFQLHQMCASVQLQQEFIFFTPFTLCLGGFFSLLKSFFGSVGCVLGAKSQIFLYLMQLTTSNRSEC